MTDEDNNRKTESMTNYEMVYDYSSSALTEQGKGGLIDAPLDSV